MNLYNPLVASLGAFVLVYAFLSAVDAIYHNYQKIQDNIIVACIAGIIILLLWWWLY